ncbi:hypothetical protein ABKA04_009350 [Annulohypoxylon sp. FPYF3050]
MVSREIPEGETFPCPSIPHFHTISTPPRCLKGYPHPNGGDAPSKYHGSYAVGQPVDARPKTPQGDWSLSNTQQEMNSAIQRIESQVRQMAFRQKSIMERLCQLNTDQLANVVTATCMADEYLVGSITDWIHEKEIQKDIAPQIHQELFVRIHFLSHRELVALIIHTFANGCIRTRQGIKTLLSVFEARQGQANGSH